MVTTDEKSNSVLAKTVFLLESKLTDRLLYRHLQELCIGGKHFLFLEEPKSHFQCVKSFDLCADGHSA